MPAAAIEWLPRPQEPPRRREPLPTGDHQSTGFIRPARIDVPTLWSGSVGRPWVRVPAGTALLEQMLQIVTGGMRVGWGNLRLEVTPGGMEIFTAAGVSVVKLQAASPHARIGANSGSVPPLLLDSLGSLVAVITAQVAAAAINNIAFTTGSSSGFTDTIEHDLLSVSLTATAVTSVLEMDFSGYITNTCTATVTLAFKIYRDAVVLKTSKLTLLTTLTFANIPLTFAELAVDTAAHTYKVTVQASGGGTVNYQLLDEALIVAERKR